jgi:hypothetical protein
MIKKNPKYNLSTDDLAELAQTKPGSIRVRLCRTGSYFGICPKKLPNGRLAWPEDSQERLFQAAETVSSAAA